MSAEKYSLQWNIVVLILLFVTSSNGLDFLV
jgi:hypothetical protein